MRKLVGYLTAYWRGLSKSVFAAAALFTALLVAVNYSVGLNKAIYSLPKPLPFVGWYLLFLFAFGAGHLLVSRRAAAHLFKLKWFGVLVLIAPAVFAWKMTAELRFDFTPYAVVNHYWNTVAYWPYKVGVIAAMLAIIHRFFHRRQGFYGATFKGFEPKPYLLMLTVMVPLIASAALLPDFQKMYPRMQAVEYLQQPGREWEILLYQLSYGLDFFSIELFFRGFLVLGFVKWVGKDAILPMAIFYCCIHFGKPLGECISSFFGGIILGVVTYHTRTIMGGFFVHVGIAWLMEIGGSFASS